MKIFEIIRLLDAKVINISDEQTDIKGGYCGDFLSNVMGKAVAGSAWFTVMNNQNVAAVATLTDVGLVILCEGVQPDAALADKIKSKNLAFISTELPIFEAVRKLDL